MGATRRKCGKCDKFREFMGEFVGYWRRSLWICERVDAVSMVVVWCEAYRWLNFRCWRGEEHKGIFTAIC